MMAANENVAKGMMSKELVEEGVDMREVVYQQVEGMAQRCTSEARSLLKASGPRPT